MKKLFITLAFMAFIGSISAQNSLSWEQDGMRCSINLNTGDFSITCYDNARNAFTIYAPDYGFEVSVANGNISYRNYDGKICNVGSTSISYRNYDGKVCNIGSTSISYRNYDDKVCNIGSTSISYRNYDSKVCNIGSTSISYRNYDGKVCNVGSASISYDNSGKVCSIHGKVR